MAHASEAARMRTCISFWVMWLLVWHATGSYQQQCPGHTAQVFTGPITIQVSSAPTVQPPANQGAVDGGGSCGQASCTNGQATCAGQVNTATATVRQPGTVATVALHDLVYKSDFAGFRQKMRFYDQKENQAALIGALQSTDEKGMTIAHVLACAGRSDELFLVTQAVHKIHETLAPLPAQVFKRASLENLSFNATCTSCRPDRLEVVAHVRLELNNPRQTIFLYGNVTPLECAAAHGHVQAMKLLLQRGVAAGRAVIIAQHFGFEKQVFEAIEAAKAEGGYGAGLHPDLPTKLETPMRKPRQRRTDRKPKSKSKASAGGAAKPKAAPVVVQQQTPAPAPAPQHACNRCAAQHKPVEVTTTSGVLGGPPSVIGTVSASILGSARGKEPAEPNKPVSTPTQLSEVMDVTALWLLSIMLFFPAWSTFCLLWRKLSKRKWTLQELAAGLREALWCVLAAPFSLRRRPSSTSTPAAASAGSGSSSGPQRSSGSDSKGSSGKAAAATPRQQRKPGPSIALPGSSGADPRASKQGAASPTGGLFRAISAPEAALQSHLSGSQGAQAARSATAAGAGHAGAGSAVRLRKQASSLAAVTDGASLPAESAAAKGASGTLRSGTAGGVHQPGKAAAASSENSGAAATSTPAGSKQQKRGKQAPAATAQPAGAAARENCSSSSPAVKDGSAAASTAQKVVKPPAVLSKSSKAAAASTAGVASSSSSQISKAAATGSGVYKAHSEASGLLAAANHKTSTQAAATAAAAAAAASVAASSISSRGVGADGRMQPQSALSAALRSGRASPADSTADSCVGSPTSTASSSRAGHQGTSLRKPHGMSVTVSSPAGRASPSPASASVLSPSRGASGRFALSAAAAAAAVRDAAAASAAASAALRRTASGGVMPSPRSPLGELDDVLNRSRDQDRPHGAAGSIDEDGSGAGDMASSAPSSNAWTPAAAAARAARAGTSTPVKAQRGEAEEGQQGPGADADFGLTGAYESSLQSAASPHTPRREPAAAPGGSSAQQGLSTPAAAEAALACTPFVDSFTAAAIAAGILPSPSARGAAGVAPDEGGAGGSAKAGLLHAHDSSLDAADAAAATAYAAAVAALPSDAYGEPAAGIGGRLHHSAGSDAAELHPPESLLPVELLARLDAAPGPAPVGAGSSGSLLRSVSALEPRMVQDLAHLVAVSIAQEVARGKHADGQPCRDSPQHAGVPPAAAPAADERVSESGSFSEAAAQAMMCGGPSSASSSSGAGAGGVGSGQLPGLMELLDRPLQEVLASALTAQAAPAAAEAQGGFQLQDMSELSASAPPAAGAFSASFGGGQQGIFGFGSEQLFGDLAEQLRQSPTQPQHQEDQEVAHALSHQQQQLFGVPASGQLSGATSQQQQGWLGAVSGPMQAAAVSGPVLVDSQGQMLLDPPGLGGNSGNVSKPAEHTAVSTGLQAATAGQQMFAGPAAPTSAPPGTAGPVLITAQQLVAVQQQPMPQHQQQQQVLAQQQHPMQQGVQVVTLAPAQQHQQQTVQVVSVQHVAAAAAGHPQQGQSLIRLPNGQLVTGQLLAVQGMQGAGQVSTVPVVAATPAGTPVVFGPGGQVVGVQQVQHVTVQQQQQPRLFVPQSMLHGGGAQNAHMPHAPGTVVVLQQQGNQQQQQQVMMPHQQQQGPQLVQVQLQGGMLHNVTLQQQGPSAAGAAPAAAAGPAMQRPQHKQYQKPKHKHGRQLTVARVMPFANGGIPPHTGSPAQRASFMLRMSPAGGRTMAGSPAAGSGSNNSRFAGPVQQQTPVPAASEPSSSSSVSGGSSTMVTVLEAPAGPSGNSARDGMSDEGGKGGAVGAELKPTESAQMAADLDELLNQANRELGWSPVP